MWNSQKKKIFKYHDNSTTLKNTYSYDYMYFENVIMRFGTFDICQSLKTEQIEVCCTTHTNSLMVTDSNNGWWKCFWSF